MKFTRKWAMPNSETFSVLPIGALTKCYLESSTVSIDPFARNNRWATYTNDLNPNTDAEYHLDVLDFLKLMVQNEVRADLVLFDPPYSPRQIKECYDSIGQSMKQEDAMRTNWQDERGLIDQLLVPGGFVISYGWNSIGMGKKRSYEHVELLLVCHGVGHNDTIVLVEKKLSHQLGLAL